jgi:hypothetical protein
VDEILALYRAEVTLPQLQSEIKVALFLFASHSFLANNLRFMVKLIDKAMVKYTHLSKVFGNVTCTYFFHDFLFLGFIFS